MTPAPSALILSDALSGRVLAGQLWASPVRVAPADAALEQAIESYCRETRAANRGRSPGQVEGVAAARELYRLFGLDPTKLRPSSEALLRRVLREQPFPRISNAVDLANLLALRFLLPIGLYDADRVEGPVTLRVGDVGESYRGVRKDTVHLHGRPVLADARGPFGNPTADSARTAVTDKTRGLWMVVFAPASLPAGRLEGQLEFGCEAMRRFLAPEAGRVDAAWGIAG